MRHTNLTQKRGAIRGFTVIELTVAMTVSGILFGLGFVSMRDYARSQRARMATQALAWSVTLARSSAIRAGATIILAVDEAQHTAVVKDTAGTVLLRRNFGNGSDYLVDRLDLDLAGDSLIFNRRGMCLNCRQDQATQVFIDAAARKYTLEVGLLGRTEVKRR